MTSPDQNESQLDFQSQVKVWDDPKNATDLFAREAFAGRISSALSNWKKDESLVVALFGNWGTGKTWLLHRIRDQLEQEENFTVCDFSPWQFESNEQISSEFFTAILEVLREDSSPDHKERAKLWATLGAMVSVAKIGTTMASMANPAIAVANPILSGIGKLLSAGENAADTATQQEDLTLTGVRASLLNLFKAEDAPKILVTIDDLDRLPDEQIQMIFRLLKTTVNFPNLHFLLLGERHQLAKALDPVAHNEGDRYMEKIVQVPVYMPEIDSVLLKNRMQEGLALIADRYGYTITSERLSGRDEALWNDFLKIKLTNLRAIYRLLTVVEFKCSALSYDGKLEVDLLDLLSIEYLRLYAPKTYGKLLGDLFYLTHGFRRIPTAKQGPDEETDSLDILNDSELGGRGAYHACSHLFPKFPEAVSNWSANHMPASERKPKVALLSSERPISDPSYQPLYFKLSLDEKILNRSSYETVLNEADERKLEGQLLGLESHVRWLLFQHMLAEDTFVDKVKSLESWLKALSNVSDALDDTNTIFRTSESRYAYRVWLRLFEVIPSDASQVTFIESLFGQTEAVTLLAILLEDLRNAADIIYAKNRFDRNESLPCLDKETLNSFSDQLLQITLKALRAKSYPISNQSGGRLYRLIHAIGCKRFEEILRDPGAINFEGAMTIAEAIAIAILPRYHTNLMSPDSLDPKLSSTYFNELVVFASPEFWTDLVKRKPDELNLSEQQNTLFEHIRIVAQKRDAAEVANIEI